MNPKLIAAALVIISLPVCAHAQKPTAAKVTNADAQKVVKMIGSDKTKIQIYCDIVKLGDQMDETNSKDKKKIEELDQRMEELAAKLGPEYVALVGGLEEMDPNSKDSKEINSTLEGLEDKLCPK
jgi:peptidoglycan hydrolase CwlO-like protein